MPREQIFDQTGIQFMQINTLYQLLSMVIARDPQLEAARTFLTIPDLFNYWLSGKISCEFTNATTTQCFNPRSRSWAFPLLRGIGHPDAGSSHPSANRERAWERCSRRLQLKQAPVPSLSSRRPATIPARQWQRCQPASRISPGSAPGTWSILGAEIQQPIIERESPGIQLHQRRRGMRHMAVIQEHHGAVAGAGVQARMGPLV